MTSSMAATHLNEFISVFLEDLCVLLYFVFVPTLGSIDEDEQWNVRLQEGVAHVINDSLAQLTTQVLRPLAHVLNGHGQTVRRILRVGLFKGQIKFDYNILLDTCMSIYL